MRRQQKKPALPSPDAWPNIAVEPTPTALGSRKEHGVQSDNDLLSLVRDIEDRLFPGLKLDVWERVVYWHLLRQTHLEGQDSVVLGLDPLARATAMSTTKLRDTLRAMATKGCLIIDDRSRSGHMVRVLLPDEVASLPARAKAPEEVDIETLDCFTDRRFMQPLWEREQQRCFYCLARLTPDAAVLDHVVAQVNGGNNSYRNVVIACHACNARKQAISADDFLRVLYREGMLSAIDLKERLNVLLQLRDGKLVPRV